LRYIFGAWKKPWGEINRYQRLTGDIVQPFNDGGPSIPVGFTSSLWGSLASFGARPYPRTKKWYGANSNSFVAVVEFAKAKVRAKAVTARSIGARSRPFMQRSSGNSWLPGFRWRWGAM